MPGCDSLHDARSFAYPRHVRRAIHNLVEGLHVIVQANLAAAQNTLLL